MNGMRVLNGSKLVAILMLVVGAVALPSATRAQGLGARIQKSCTSIKRCAGACTTSGAPCASDLGCPPDTCVGGSCSASGAPCSATQLCHECLLGSVCNSAADCSGFVFPPGITGVCVGGPDAGNLLCSTVTDCRAASDCSTCIPVQQVTTGDTFSCELLVTNVSTPTHAEALGQLTDLIRRAPSTCMSPSTPVTTPPTGCLFDVFKTGTVFGQCIGGSSPQKRCQSDTECVGGTCSLTRHCIDRLTNADGGACAPLGASCTVGGVTGVCSAILPRTDPAPDSFLVAVHTDVAKSTDPNPLNDTAATMGEDLAQVAPSVFNLDFGGFINVLTLPQVVGCRITGGGAVNGMIDPNIMADITSAQFSGQVGAPCGCFGCFDNFDPKRASVQGEWNHQRKNKGGSLHASIFNSLVCSCLGGQVGELCPSAEHPSTPADHICVTGIGDFMPDKGNPHSTVGIPVAFRFEATDNGEPGSHDVYEMHILMPAAGQTTADLAKAICCTRPFVQPAGTTVIANDSGSLIAGNVQIHPALAKSTDGTCPPPSGMCVPIP